MDFTETSTPLQGQPTETEKIKSLQELFNRPGILRVDMREHKTLLFLGSNPNPFFPHDGRGPGTLVAREELLDAIKEAYHYTPNQDNEVVVGMAERALGVFETYYPENAPHISSIVFVGRNPNAGEVTWVTFTHSNEPKKVAFLGDMGKG